MSDEKQVRRYMCVPVWIAPHLNLEHAMLIFDVIGDSPEHPDA